MKILIIQTSPPHTASTLLVNAVYGLISELSDKKIIYSDNIDNIINTNNENIMVIKTHDTNIDELNDKYNKKYNLVFICSERQEKNYKIDEKYKSYKNVLIFDFDELNETINNTLTVIVDNLYNKINHLFIELGLEDIKLDKTKCIERICAMNSRYEEIKYEPFSFVDDFFEIHGSPRNRLEP
jgi:uncharacterized coiled-coil DUF342 family protein